MGATQQFFGRITVIWIIRLTQIICSRLGQKCRIYRCIPSKHLIICLGYFYFMIPLYIRGVKFK